MKWKRKVIDGGCREHRGAERVARLEGNNTIEENGASVSCAWK